MPTPAQGKGGSDCGEGGRLGSQRLRDSPYLTAKAFSRVQAACNHTTRTHNFTPLTDSSRRTHSARAFTDCCAEPRRYGRLWGSGFSLPLCKPGQIQPRHLQYYSWIASFVRRGEYAEPPPLELTRGHAGKPLPPDARFSAEGCSSSRCRNRGAAPTHFCANLDANSYQ